MTRQPWTRIGVTALVGVMLVSALGCQREASKGSDERIARLQELQARREAKTKELGAMNIEQLARALEADSQKGAEPFNSMGYRELISRGESVAPALAPLLTKADRSSFLGLLALRKVSPGRYQSLTPSFRVAVLTDALKNSRFFNTWGIPHLYWEDAAKSLIAEGKAAEPALLAMLRDTREAPVWGSEGVAISKQYGYRVCDYAWSLINEIRSQKVEIPYDPAARDKLIEVMLRSGGPGVKHKP